MPSSKQRHRVEIPEDLYQQIHVIAMREGYKATTRFIVKLLEQDVKEYTEERQAGRYRFDSPTLMQRAAAYLAGCLPRHGHMF